MQERLKLQTAWTWGTKILEKNGLKLPRLEAEVLLLSVLGLERAELYARLNDFMTVRQYEFYCSLIYRRSEGFPCQYLTGEQEFMSLPFKVTTDVLIPRPETELLAEFALEILKDKTGESCPVLELCTGSGALIISLLYNLPQLKGVATDLSAAALKIAKFNARRLGVENRINFLQGDLFEPVQKQLPGQKFELVLANPPYIPCAEIDLLQVEVARHEPRMALDGGEDGLLFYRRIAGQLEDFLDPGGMVALEIGTGQQKAVSGLLTKTGLFERVEVLPDLAGFPRVVVGSC